MKHPFARRSLGAVLALMLIVSALPVSALAARTGNAEFTLIELKGTDVTLDETVFEYTGQEITPNVTVRVDDRLLTLDQDYTLAYENNVEVGTGKVIVTGIATAAPSYGYTGTVEVPFYINEKSPEFTLIELKGTDVTINGTEFVYTGSPIEPAITVNAGGKTLTPEQDYTVEYVNNLLPGTATVIIRGIATASETVGYTGEVRIDFTITPSLEETLPPVEITALNVTLEGEEFPYTGQEIRPAVTVSVEGQTLESGSHYTVSYENNIQPGTASVLVTAVEGSGYMGEVRMDFTITAPAQEEYPLVEIKAENVAMDGSEFPYTGNPIEPKVTVTVGGKVLVQGKDYSLTYTNNVSVGTATATVAGIATATEAGGYTGTVELKFTIVPMTEDTYPLVEIKGTDVTIEGTKFFYTGKEIRPAVTVTVDGKVLTADRDYSVKYENNINVGTGTVIVSGIATATETGGYTGQVRIDFAIVPQYTITQGSGAVFTKGSSNTLTFTASGEVQDFDYLTINGRTVDSKYYTVKEGSTVLTLKNSFLNILNAGKYTITFHYTDGEAEGTFTVAAAAAADGSNPKTGDEFPLHALYAVMFVSLTGIIGSVFAWKKKLFQSESSRQHPSDEKSGS